MSRARRQGGLGGFSRPAAHGFRFVAGALVAGLAAWPAFGQEPPARAAPERETVVQLAYVLGQAHALRRLCVGSADATWYGRMQRLQAQEAQSVGARRQLADAFNAGFSLSQARYPRCGPGSEAAEREAARRGGELARRLAAAP